MRDVQVGGPCADAERRMSAVDRTVQCAPASGLRRDIHANDARRRQRAQCALARPQPRSQDVLALSRGGAAKTTAAARARRGLGCALLGTACGVRAFGQSPWRGAPPMRWSPYCLTGYIPPSRLQVRAGSRGAVDLAVSDRWAGSGEGLLASDDAVDGAAVAGGPLTGSSSLAINLGGYRSSRFLDPTHPDNFHNSGSATTGGGEWRWRMSPSSTLRAVAGVSRSVRVIT